MPQPGQTSLFLADIRMDARQRSDTENDPHVSDAELNRWINTGYYAFYDRLVTTFDGYYFGSKAPITTDGVNDTYPLPPDLYKLTLVEVQNAMGATINSNVPAWITVRPLASLREKNRYTLINFATYFGYLNIRYFLLGSGILFAPLPNGGQQIRVWYAPRLTPLADAGLVRVTGVQAGDALTVNGTTFTAVAGAPSGTQFQVGATDAATASNLAAAISAAGLAGVVNVTAGPTSSPVAAGNPDGSTVIPASPNLPQNVVAVTIYGATVTWSSTNAQRIALRPGPQGALADATVTPTTYTWGDVADGVSGWTDMLAIQAALEALGKQERDPSRQLLAKAEVDARLERAAPNRNLADPATVTETGGDFPFPGVPGVGWPGGSYF